MSEDRINTMIDALEIHIKLMKEENAKLKEGLLLTQDQLRDAVEMLEGSDNKKLN